MVKSKNQHNQKEGVKQGGKEGGSKTRKIKASTHHGYVDEHLSPYGGLLPLVKLWDGLKFDVSFSTYYCTGWGQVYFLSSYINARVSLWYVLWKTGFGGGRQIYGYAFKHKQDIPKNLPGGY